MFSISISRNYGRVNRNSSLIYITDRKCCVCERANYCVYCAITCTCTVFNFIFVTNFMNMQHFFVISLTLCLVIICTLFRVAHSEFYPVRLVPITEAFYVWILNHTMFSTFVHIRIRFMCLLCGLHPTVKTDPLVHEICLTLHMLQLSYSLRTLNNTSVHHTLTVRLVI